MGGKDYCQVDKEAGDAGLGLYDMRAMARECRQASIRIVRFLPGEAGMRQFLDIGTGLPAMRNTPAAPAPDVREAGIPAAASRTAAR